MLNAIKPADFWRHPGPMDRLVDRASYDELIKFRERFRNAVHEVSELDEEACKLLASASFEPGLPLLITVQSTTPALYEVMDLGRVGSARKARTAAADHYSLLEPEDPHAAEDDEGVNHLYQQILLHLELRTRPHFSAKLPKTYDLKPELQPAFKR